MNLVAYLFEEAGVFCDVETVHNDLSGEEIKRTCSFGLTRNDRLLDLFEQGTRVFHEYRVTPRFRLCTRCDEVVICGEPDPCIGMLPGVSFACCGHGEERGYINFDNGVTIRFRDAWVDGMMPWLGERSRVSGGPPPGMESDHPESERIAMTVT